MVIIWMKMVNWILRYQSCSTLYNVNKLLLYCQSLIILYDDLTQYIFLVFFFYQGTIVLWVCWPSFNAVLVEGVARHRAIVNTYYAIVTSCVTSCAFSSLMTKASKLSMVSFTGFSMFVVFVAANLAFVREFLSKFSCFLPSRINNISQFLCSLGMYW